MNIKSFSTNFRAGCAGLTAALMVLSSTSAYAQQQGDAVQSNGSTKVLPVQGGRGAGGLGRGNIIAAIAQSGGAGSTGAAATIAAIQAAAGGGAAAGDTLITALTNAGVAPGLAANLAVVATLTPATVASILASVTSSLPTPNSGSGLTASLSKSTGTLVASSKPMFLAQTNVAQAQDTNSAVREAYTALTQAFIAGGVDATNAQRNAANLLIALASVKYAAPAGGGVNLSQINRIATLIQPAIAATPGLRKAITDNPNLSLTTFRQIQATIGVLEPMALLVRVVNENV